MVHTTAETTTVSPLRAGPPGCGNGGWVCGLLTERLDDLVPAEGDLTAATVRLSAPTPLERPLRWEVDGTVADGSGLAVHLLDGETLLGTARRTTAPELTVPATALIPGEPPSVWVVTRQGDAARVARRTVTKGTVREGRVQVTAGLSSGDEVVIRGVGSLQDGQAVGRRVVP